MSTRKSLFNRHKKSTSIPVRHSKSSIARASSVASRDNGPERRALSSDRFSLHRQGSSADLKSSSRSSKLVTPRSVTKNFLTPQNSERSSRTRSRSPRSKQENRPITNKSWQSEQLLVVQEFISLTNPQLASEIHPPLTINIFVDVMQELLAKLDHRIEINSANYVKNVPSYLKTLNYPINVTASLMKTVNIKHSWPQILGIFSWLVAVINIITPSEDVNLFNKVECQAMFNVFFELFNSTNNTNNSEDTTKIIHGFRESLINSFGCVIIDLDVYRNNVDLQRKEVETERNVVQKLQKECDQLRTEEWELKQQHRCLVDGRKKELESLKQKVLDSDHKNAHLNVEIQNKLKSIQLLKEQIANQTVTAKQARDLERKVQDLKVRFDLKQQRRELRLRDHDEADMEISCLKKEIETRLYSINNTLYNLSLTHKGVKLLLLPEKDFMNASAINKLEEIDVNLNKLINNIKEETIAIQNATKDKNILGITLQNNLQSTLKELKNLKTTLVETEKNVGEERNSYKMKITHLHKSIEELKINRSNLPNNEGTVHELEEKVNSYSKILKEKELELKTHHQNASIVFKKLFDDLVQFVTVINDELINLTEEGDETISTLSKE